MNQAWFEVEVSQRSALEFATVSGDWNPLHTNPEHAAQTPYRQLVLHGAFSAGLVSRMAGMFLPGADCLLHSMQLRFLAPIIPPATLKVVGSVAAESANGGRVDVTISDSKTGVRYVEAHYEFGRHEAHASEKSPAAVTSTHSDPTEDIVIVTGASGGLGDAVCTALGSRAIGISRAVADRWVSVADLERFSEQADVILRGRRVSAIVHCAWPAPDNVPLTGLTDITASVEHFVATPLRQMISLAQLLKAHGTADAMLLLVGSAFAEPGRHNYRMPLYTVGKAMIPALTRALALDLGVSGQRCAAVVFDVLDAGMNQRMTRAARLSHANRVPSGCLPTASDAAAQVCWILENKSSMASGTLLSMLGGAIP
jgi:NAD(P)-dependent dehydrogenase (short-subunit alcohol dehydrogenase family)